MSERSERTHQHGSTPGGEAVGALAPADDRVPLSFRFEELQPMVAAIGDDDEIEAVGEVGAIGVGILAIESW